MSAAGKEVRSGIVLRSQHVDGCLVKSVFTARVLSVRTTLDEMELTL